ncbi:UbiH/UbiF family hydroxylase [Bradyrhizobium sp. WBOS7]|uniref:UbiH/UbiF family hydroxylase n=1 Tax=Bradyrhizobium betae TaxID=244734 RepID=A0AAE9NEN2_9BRAD|nr:MULTISPECIES: UbiH/UbiF family hydroxylase [Bradyrhizobium]MDD1571736.1 UbiH/UbiF family hydroxylase [Bradyrhizobium sp. WBOS1]UUO37196.1 UbiH/UbiF family hydroxylase [Bradyrhizobium sp. WBOS01]MDD1531745.1 UbiH/UbiF family hydroxylase [Bradyrhizobium sp. WBOS2]MDD1581246.1 UbiH/UbiF family hydroxylase [Bradyrhizobium sp. WBOS7]MDD1600097.1 UbiH/UbiF family hydroxylase [Bradyrhizobium sp. WBOS16]
MTDASTLYDTAVIGGGPAGLAAAIALAQAGGRTALVARRAPYADNRTTALLGASVDLLETLDVWSRCRDKAAALEVMRLVDDTGRLFRAPEVRFSCHEIALDAFGYNIDNRSLMLALEERAAELPNLVRFDDEAESIVVEAEDVAIRTASAQFLAALLVVGADGRHSLCREAARIDVSRRELNQTALTFNVGHTRPHRNVSTEFHTPHGPCVFVPLPGDRSSVVWVSAPAEAERLRSLDDAELSAAVERQSHSILGRMSVEPGRNLFPLAIERPKSFGRDRIALVGEAAHVVPPIGAQGLNLGLRDAADIARLAGEAVAAGQDPGADEVLTRYDRARRPDILSRTFAIDIANRSLLNDFLALQPVRAAGMHLLGAIGPLRRFAMREGLTPTWRR